VTGHAQGIISVFKSLDLQYSSIGRRKYRLIAHLMLPVRIPEKKHDEEGKDPYDNGYQNKAEEHKKECKAQPCQNKWETFFGKGPLVMYARFVQY
jgi:hypothetical protein